MQCLKYALKRRSVHLRHILYSFTYILYYTVESRLSKPIVTVLFRKSNAYQNTLSLVCAKCQLEITSLINFSKFPRLAFTSDIEVSFNFTDQKGLFWIFCRFIFK